MNPENASIAAGIAEYILIFLGIVIVGCLIILIYFNWVTRVCKHCQWPNLLTFRELKEYKQIDCHQCGKLVKI